jgi:sugar lactone lactonase YvrE
MRRILSIVLLALAPAVAQAQSTIATKAGGGPNNIPALSSSIGTPLATVQDSTGNVYVADAHSNRVYKISTSGTLTVFAGNGSPGYAGDGAAAVNAQLFTPSGLAIDGTGNLFIADSGNNVIREVLASNGFIQTVAGNNAAGPGYSGDNGSPTAAQLNNPNGVFVDSSNNIYIADSGNNVIREVVAATTKIQAIAGNFLAGPGFSGDNGVPTAAQLNNPLGVTLDTAGNIFIADHNNNRIREVVFATGKIQTFAGTGVPGVAGDGGLATAAQLNGPSAVYATGSFADASGALYLADTNNHIIRKVLSINLKINAVAGNGLPGFTGDGGPAIFAELTSPRGVSVDTTGNIFIADTGNSFVREVAALNGAIHIFGGNGTVGLSGDGFAALNAALNLPASVAVDNTGNIFIADTSNNIVREVVVATGLIQTIAGRGQAGFSGNGSAINALLNGPAGVYVDGSGNIYIADTKNHVIREVIAATGNIQTVAGNASQGFSGDTGFAIQAQLNSPTGVFVDAAGNIYIADTGNHVIRKVTIADGKINTIAGNFAAGPGYSGDTGSPTSAQLHSPNDVYVDSFGNIFIADTANNVIREVVFATGKIQTFAGNFVAGPGYSGDNGVPAAAQLNGPTGVLVDASSDVFIADANNHVIREVVASTGKIQTVAGNHTAGFSGDGGAATSAKLDFPSDVALDRLGGIFIADSANNRIRDVTGLVPIATAGVSTGALSFSNQVIGTTSASQPVVLTNTGASPLAVFNITITGANNGDFAQTNNCGASLPVGTFCTINVTFTPSTGGVRAATLSIADSSPTSPHSVTLGGTGVSAVVLSPTGLSFPLQINNTSSASQPITLTNNQTIALAITSIVISGTNAASFSQLNTCGVSVPAGGNCTINVTFRPVVTGSNSANVVVTDDAPGGSQSATLFGLGTAATADLTPTSLTFTTQQIGTTSAGQTVTLTNHGTDSLNISSISFTGTNANDFGRTTTCPSSVLAGNNCTVTVTFTPTAGGARSANLSFADSAGNSPQSIPVGGTGLDFQIVVASGGSSSATVTAGATASYSLQVTTVGGASNSDSIAVTLTCLGAPTGATCTVPSAPVTVTPATSANINVSISTTHAFLPPGSRPGPYPGLERLILVMLILMTLTLVTIARARDARQIGFLRAVKSWASAMALVALLGLSAAFFTSCSTNNNSNGGVTPPGTYNITVEGKAGTISHDFIVTMTVQ